MDKDEGSSYRQALHDLSSLLTGQWTIAVIATLAVGELPFGEVKNDVNRALNGQRNPISPRVLTDTLKRLEKNQLVERREEDDAKVGASRVYYKLSPDGRELLSMLRPLASWAANRRTSESS
ncbi:winged helix-turn-helix transcriptional regulator [Amycolatopsis nivea]|uniref:winged helix-turn-helix transcriptional regulator n=1 Tax=unclassified Amycolatopsis TaxID=2618356 RepID=UPI0035259A0E